MGTQLFDEMIGELPASTVDVAGIVRREKRRGSVRKATGLTAAAVTISVTTALGLSVTGDRDPSAQPSAIGSSAPAAPDTRFALVAQTDETAAGSAKHLSQALDAALRKEVPGAEWISEPGVEGRDTPDGQPPNLAYHVGADERAQELFSGGTGVEYQGRKGSLHLGVEPAEGVGEDGVPRHNILECPPTGPTCTEGVAPSGTKMLFLSATNGNVQTYGYDVGLPDGRILRITHSNDLSADGAGAAQKGTPLTSDQVKAIAIDVASQIKA